VKWGGTPKRPPKTNQRRKNYLKILCPYWEFCVKERCESIPLWVSESVVRVGKEEPFPVGWVNTRSWEGRKEQLASKLRLNFLFSPRGSSNTGFLDFRCTFVGSLVESSVREY